MNLQSEAASGAYISRIVVEQLFGRYNYTITNVRSVDPSLPNLLILYGENGSGKTKILNLTYHMLISTTGGGHRTFIASQPFKRFLVELSNGICVSASREGDNPKGDFTWAVTKNGQLLFDVVLTVDQEGKIPGELPPAIEAKYASVVDVLRQQGLQLFFLSDDRKILSEFYKKEETKGTSKRDILFQRRVPLDSYAFALEAYRGGLPKNIVPLDDVDDAMAKLVNWIKDKQYSGSSLGETNASTIYNDVIKRIAQSQAAPKNPSAKNILKLIENIDQLSVANKEYSELGLMPSINMGEIAETLRRARGKRTEDIMYDVSRPYIDGMRARFEALEEIKNRIGTFLANINDFYMDKTVDFHLTKGITITSKDGQQLSPSMLSSGEKQLMLLLCHTIIASEQSSIFIIDEPEISLNVTWQRKLIRALLECSGHSNFQLLLATHSIELLTQYSQNVVKLVNQE